MAICPTSFFQAKQARENVFYDILERKNTFLGYKNKQFKKSKNCHFSKGVNPWFLDKNGFFDKFFFFFQNRQRKCVLRYSKTKKTPFYAIKKKFKKTKKCHFSKGVNPWFLVQKRPFFQFFFQEKWARKMSFTIFQNKKKMPFQAIKTGRSKSGKIDIFPKRLTHGFGPKMAIFSTSFFRQYRQEKCVLRYSKTKKRLSRL